MKRLLLFLGICCALTFLNAQEPCGFDSHQRELELKHPQERIAREKFEAKLLATNVHAYLKKIGAITKNNLYSGTIYEIPVVIHVIEPSASSAFASYTVTDAQIQTWIDNTNKMYATTYSTFFPEGSGSYDGTVIPFKLVLAKRDPQCAATTGIIRVSGASNSNYDNSGVYNSSNGASADEVRAISPHWSESSYFNIYIVTTFDANTTTYGLMGWCGYPTNSDAYYDSFMKVAAVKKTNNTTLAHEFGHGMGLMHPFGTANSSGGECPTNADCTTDNDKVCDTEPTQSLLNTTVYPLASVASQGINTCTGVAYDGVQYNVMNYTSRPQKFTQGQRERALATFLQTRGSLTNSVAATDLSADESVTLTSATCAPSSIQNAGNYNMGPTSVSLNTINNSSEGYNTGGQFYIDYASMACLNKNFITDLEINKPYTLSVGFKLNDQCIRVWIDYNNNGTFESNELVGDSNGYISASNSPFSATVTPPASATANTYLRMRVRCDFGTYNACDALQYGQVEDYAVRLISATTSIALTDNSKLFVAYNKLTNKLLLLNSDKSFGDYEIYDVSGKIIKKGYSENDEISLNKLLGSGVYILKFKLDGLLISKRVLIN